MENSGDGTLAEQADKAGVSVVAGLKACGHGTAATTVPGPLKLRLHPTVYWASLASSERRQRRTASSENRIDRDAVIYPKLVVSLAPVKALKTEFCTGHEVRA